MRRKGVRIAGILAVLPLDAFTGRPVRSNDFWVEIKGMGRPIRKQEGFYVFSGVVPVRDTGGAQPEQEEPFVCIRLWGRGYRRRELRQSVCAVCPGNPVVTVCMEPDRDYPFLPGTIFMEGRLGAGTSVLAAAAGRGNGLCLAADYRAGEKMISIYGGEKRDFSGCAFYMAEADGGQQGDWIFLDGRKSSEVGSYGLAEAGSYRLEIPAARSRCKAKTRLFPAFARQASEETERYFLAFPVSGITDAERGSELICRVENGASVTEHRLQVRPGERVSRDF